MERYTVVMIDLDRTLNICGDTTRKKPCSIISFSLCNGHQLFAPEKERKIKLSK